VAAVHIVVGKSGGHLGLQVGVDLSVALPLYIDLYAERILHHQVAPENGVIGYRAVELRGKEIGIALVGLRVEYAEGVSVVICPLNRVESPKLGFFGPGCALECGGRGTVNLLILGRPHAGHGGKQQQRCNSKAKKPLHHVLPHLNQYYAGCMMNNLNFLSFYAPGLTFLVVML
jgi:hypothetical protein